MARVVVVPLTTEVGHLHATLALAKALIGRGHDVRYLALKELEQDVRKQNVPYEPLFEHVRLEIPRGRGWLARQAVTLAVQEIRARIPWNNTMFDLMLSGEAGRQLEVLRPDVLLVDNMWPQLALVARALKLPVALLGTTPSFRRGQPRRGLVARIAERLLGSLSRRLGLRFREATRVLAERCNVPSTSFELDGLLPRFVGEEMPELLLYPEGLEDEGASPGLHVGPCVDVDRVEPPFDFDRLPPEGELFYCALGSRETSEREALEVFQPIIEAVSRRPGSTLVLAAGRHGPALGPVPSNVVVVERAPQLALLRRATLMFTHGGLGSIKECLYFQVPMVVVPMRFDQHENAARVDRQKLGIALPRGRRTAADFTRAVDQVLGDSAYRKNVVAVGERLRSDERRAAAVDRVEALLDATPR